MKYYYEIICEEEYYNCKIESDKALDDWGRIEKANSDGLLPDEYMDMIDYTDEITEEEFLEG